MQTNQKILMKYNVVFFRAHGYLTRAEELYDNYNSQCDVSPHTLHDHFMLERTNEIERRKAFENLHTYTLFYLAQVYKSLGMLENFIAVVNNIGNLLSK